MYKVGSSSKGSMGELVLLPKVPPMSRPSKLSAVDADRCRVTLIFPGKPVEREAMATQLGGCGLLPI